MKYKECPKLKAGKIKKVFVPKGTPGAINVSCTSHGGQG